MTIVRIAGFTSLALLAGTIALGAGCSSSTAQKAQGGGDSGVHDTGSTGIDSSTAHDTGASSGDSSSGDSSGDAGLLCPPGSTSSYTAPTYVPAVGNQGVCTTTAISAFVAACGYSMAATMGTCATWQAANVGADAGTACGNCIMAPKNNGGIWLDPNGANMAYNGAPNYAACIQLIDPTHGTACATAFNNASGCEGVACDNACPMNATNQDFSACTAAADMGSCSTYATPEATACATDLAADGGTATPCFPAASSNNPDDDLRYIANLVCGGTVADAGDQ